MINYHKSMCQNIMKMEKECKPPPPVKPATVQRASRQLLVIAMKQLVIAYQIDNQVEQVATD